MISRKDIDALYERHVLHALGIAKVVSFAPHAKILDVGTGGPPLAILFPETNFYLVDSIQKKIGVVNAVAASVGLTNVKATHQRAEQVNGKFDFVVSRAVTQMPRFVEWVQDKISLSQQHDLAQWHTCTKRWRLDRRASIFSQSDPLSACQLFSRRIFFYKICGTPASLAHMRVTVVFRRNHRFFDQSRGYPSQ